MVPVHTETYPHAFSNFVFFRPSHLFKQWREVSADKHYMRGGKPGDFPDFKAAVIPGGALNLYDPFGVAKKMTEEQREKRLLMEINNGRLAMLGIFGFLSESKIEGSVPVLKGIIGHYDGDYMAPLTSSILPALPSNPLNIMQ